MELSDGGERRIRGSAGGSAPPSMAGVRGDSAPPNDGAIRGASLPSASVPEPTSIKPTRISAIMIIRTKVDALAGLSWWCPHPSMMGSGSRHAVASSAPARQ